MRSIICECRNLSSSQPVASRHGAVLALVASVLSVPYDMPRFACLKYRQLFYQVGFLLCLKVKSTLDFFFF